MKKTALTATILQRKQKKKQLKILQDWYSMFQKPRLKLRLPHQKQSLNKTVLVIPKFMTIFLMMTMGRMKREGATFCKGCDIEFEGYSNFINHLKVGTPCWKEHRPPWPDPPLPVAHQTKWAPPWRPRTGKSICFVFALGRFCVYLFGIMKKCNLFARKASACGG